MKFTATAMASATLVALTNAHGFITSPKPRMPGATFQQACGQQVYYNQMGDNYGNVQGMLQVANSQSDYNAAACNIWMCKGYKYADNTANVQKYTAGQTVPITVDIRAPHTGNANVSIVATANNKMISKQLISFTNYASTATGVTPAMEQFNIVMPSDLGTQCSTPGACVIQWFWDAPDINQTYESCVDFTLSGSGASTPSKVVTSAASPATTAAPVTTAKPTTKAAVASTCACGPAKRDAFAQDSYCQASTITVSSVSTITQTATIYPTTSAASNATTAEAIASYSVSTSVLTTTVTAEITQTVTATVTVTASASVVAPTSAAAVTTSSTSCTTSITITRSSSSVVAPASGTGAPYPYYSANSTTAAPTAPSVSLAPVYSSALANLTSALGTGALTSVVPSASVNPVISSYLANLTSILPTGVLPTGTVPTALPSGYATVTAAPTASAPAYGGSNAAPASGMTLQQILDWLAYIVKQVFEQGQKAGAAPSSSAAPSATAPAGYQKRNHARFFMG